MFVPAPEIARLGVEPSTAMDTRLRHRIARPDDYAHFTRLMPELQTNDPVPLAAQWTKDMMPGTLIFEEGDRVVGYAFVQPMAGTGYIRHVVVADGCRGRGIGAEVMRAVAEHLRAAGCARWCLNVKPDNVPAVRLYERFGMRKAYASRAVRLPWATTATLPRDATVALGRVIDPAEDALVEATFNLPAGQLAAARVRVGRVIVGLVSEGPPREWLGVASFDPSYPGAFPFRVRAPGLAPWLYEAMRPHARPELPDVQVVVEGDEALVETLMAHGGVPTLSIVHMVGDIPSG